MIQSVCQSLSIHPICTPLQEEAKQCVKETIHDSLVRKLKDAELEAALLRERELQQQLEEANKRVEREKEETRKQSKDVQEKEAEAKGLNCHDHINIVVVVCL